MTFEGRDELVSRRRIAWNSTFYNSKTSRFIGAGIVTKFAATMCCARSAKTRDGDARGACTRTPVRVDKLIPALYRVIVKHAVTSQQPRSIFVGGCDEFSRRVSRMPTVSRRTRGARIHVRRQKFLPMPSLDRATTVSPPPSEKFDVLSFL